MTATLPPTVTVRARTPWIILLTAAAYFMVTLDSLVVVTALPDIRADLGGDIADLQWAVNAYTLAFGAGIITAATLGDRFGRRRVFIAGLVIFTTASAACALSSGIESLIAFRAVQGVGAAVITPLGFTLVAGAVPPERRGTIMGVWGGIAGLGVAIGPLVGGAVTQGLDWHWIFWVNVPIGLAAVLGCRRFLAESRGSAEPLDLIGMALVTLAGAGIVWGLVRGPEVGWGSASTALTLGGGVVLGTVFLAWQRRAAAPMVPLSLFRSRAFTAATASTFLMTGAIFSAAYLTSQFFQIARGEGPLTTGLRLLPWTVTPLIVAPIAGRLFDRIGARWLAAPGLAMQAVGFWWLARLANSGADYASYVPAFVVAGVGVSLALPTLPAAGLNAASDELLGRAAGVLNSVQRLGAAVGIAAVTAVFGSAGSLANPAATTDGYRAAILASALFSMIGVASALAVGRRR